jgi:predicted enzyme related to lactoylglutathione lyase
VKSAAVVYVKHLGPMQAFYQATFQMEAVDEAGEHCVLESDALTLSLVVVPDRIAAGILLSDPPSRRTGVPIKLAFAVDSIDDLRPVVTELGGAIDPPQTRWEFRGQIHCDGSTPKATSSSCSSRSPRPLHREIASQVPQL